MSLESLSHHPRSSPPHSVQTSLESLPCGQPNHNSQSPLRREIEHLRIDNVRLTKKRDKAVESLRTIHGQQQRMYEDFRLLREKYDDLKSEMQCILWEFVPRLSERAASGMGGGGDGDRGWDGDFDFSELSHVDCGAFETPDRIGEYEIRELLGEGQFADVRLCTHAKTRRRLAVKILPKKKVVNLAGLRRIQCEISVLRRVDHPNIVRLVDVVNSPMCVYILTEVGGRDLFEFFECNPQGVPGFAARQVVLGIASPLFHLHNAGICHRDLKPENILLIERGGHSPVSHRDVRICDFGHCASVSPVPGHLGDGGDRERPCGGERMLLDLCGSPGFFAPEMILGGEAGYSGMAADVWSLGCIALELTRGHDDFCKSWMTSYDYEVLQDEERFELALEAAVERIRKEETAKIENGNEDPTMSNFLLELIAIDPKKRIKSSDVLSHPWLADKDEGDSSKRKSSVDKSEITLEGSLVSECDMKTVDTNVIGNQNHLSNQSEEKIPIHYQEIPLQENTILTSGDAKKIRGGGTSSLGKKDKRKIFRNSLSHPAKKYFAGSDKNGDKLVIASSDHPNSDIAGCRDAAVLNGRPVSAGIVEIRLPPIESKTPSFREARRTLREGENILLSFSRMEGFSSRIHFRDIPVDTGLHLRSKCD